MIHSLCACHSGKSYQHCCKVFHEGASAPNALLLMRSRYSAYANKRADYIMRTTHPKNPRYKADHHLWTKEILQFCQSTEFQNLEILEFIDGEKEAYVTFTAHLKQNGQDATFTEKSHFEKINGQWLYLNGVYL